MTNKDLLKRIEELETRIRMLEARPVFQPVYVPQPYYYPAMPAPVYPSYPYFYPPTYGPAYSGGVGVGMISGGTLPITS